MKLASLIKSKFVRNRTPLKYKALAILAYYHNASFRGVSKSLVPLVSRSHQAVRNWWNQVSDLFACERMHRRTLAIDETKVKVNGKYVFVWAVIDVESKEILATRVTAGRSFFDCTLVMRDALKYCTNKPVVLTDGAPFYKGAIERLGCKWRLQRAGPRNHIERWFGRLKFKIKNFFNNFRGRTLENCYANLERFLDIFVQMYHLMEVA
jgi:putative transposase